MLVLVDGYSDGRSFFGAVLAVVVLRQHRELLQLPSHCDPRHAVDRGGVGTIRQHFFDRRHAGARNATELRLRKALLDPALLATAGVVRNRDAGLIELVDRFRRGEFWIARHSEHAHACGRVDDEVDHLQPVRGFRKRRN